MNELKILDGAPNEIVLERTFDAPRKLVVRAMTSPALIERWLGGKRAKMVAVEVDLRVGGSYRYRFRTHEGHEFQFTGVYREVSEERVVHTEQMDDNPSAALVTTTFTEKAGRTTMRVVMSFESPAVRDMVAATGMAEGAGESYDVLATVLTNL